MSAVLRLRARPDQLVVPVAVVALAAAGGGYFAPTWTAAGLALLGAVAIALLLATHVELGALDVTVLTSLGALACWTALSVSWSLDPAASILEAQRALLYLTALAALLLAVRRRSVTPLVAATAAACAVVSVHALAAWATDAAPPVGYSAALGLVAAAGLILALGLAVTGRALAVAAAVPLAAVLALSQSRAAVAALAIGLAVALVLAHGPRTVALILVVAAAAFALSGPGGDSLQARARVWGVALQSAAAEPLRGTGAGSFERSWRLHRPVRRNVRDAHSLYLETLAELGAVGLALLLAVLAVPLAAATRAREQPLVPAAAGAYVAYLVHAGAHWDWELPAVTLVALACAAAPIAAARRPADRRRVGARARATALAALAAAGAFAAVGTAGSVALERSRAATALGALAEARSAAHEAARLAPWSGEPWRLLGETALSRGDRAGARASFARGLRRDPKNWRLWAGLAQASDGASRRAAAQRAAELNPRS